MRRLTVPAMALAALALGVAVMSPTPAAPPGSLASAAAMPTAPHPDAVDIARAHVRAHADELGLSAEGARQLRVSSVSPSGPDGMTFVYLQQRVNAIDVHEGLAMVAVGADGSVFATTQTLVPDAEELADPAVPGLSDVAGLRAATRSLRLPDPVDPDPGTASRGPDRERELRRAGVSENRIPARLVYQRTGSGALALAWEYVIRPHGDEHWWQVRVDATTGDRLGLDDWMSRDSYLVFPGQSPLSTPQTLVTNPALTTAEASPYGWHDTNGAAGADFTVTRGNNAYAYLDLDANNTPDAGSSPDGGAGLTFPFVADLAQAPSAYRPAAVTNLFYWVNRTHDFLAANGFTAAAGNFQENNYGLGGVGADSLNAEAQDGSGSNNANFFTPPDGQRPRMQMYVWNPLEPDRDGALDPTIIVHEYAHGLAARLLGGPAVVSCQSGQETASEGWGDWLGLLATMSPDDTATTPRGLATYAYGPGPYGAGIRNQWYSTDPAVNTRTYADLPTLTSPHGVGEVWAQAMWELTWAYIDKYGFDADLATGNGGQRRLLQTAIAGLKLSVCNPGFLDGRDSLLMGDLAVAGGADQCLIWKTFAGMGMGYSAVQGTSANKADQVPADDLPPACTPPPASPTTAPTPTPTTPPTTPPVVTPVGPTAPTAVKVRRKGVKKLKVTFKAGDNRGLSASYTVSCVSTNGGKKRTAKSARTSLVVKKLTSGRTYRCRVRSTTAAGASRWSRPSAKIRVR